MARHAAKRIDADQLFAGQQRPGVQACWEAVWQGLSVPARTLYLHLLPDSPYGAFTRSLLPLEKIKGPPGTIEELTAAHLAERRAGEGKKKPAGLAIAAPALAFAERLIRMRLFHLLHNPEPHSLDYYCNQTFIYPLLQAQIQHILAKAGIQEDFYGYNVFRVYVEQHHWIDWVLSFLNDPLARRLVERVLQTAEPVPQAELLALPDAPADKIREALQALRAGLVLFEDLQKKTHEIVVGLLPAVRRKLERYREPRQRPELRLGATPADLGPAGSVLLDDVRALLVELASQPARLKQGGDLYQREYDRLSEAMPELPEWLGECLQGDHGVRSAWQWGRRLRLVERHVEEGTNWLRLNAKGREFLRFSLAEQYRTLFEAHRRLPRRQSGYDEFDYEAASRRFLGCDLMVTTAKQGQGRGYYGTMSEVEEETLRERFFQTLALLPVGSFLELDKFVEHAVFKENNPLLPDPRPARLRVVLNHKQVPDVPEQLEEAGQESLRLLIRGRLVPLGCLQAGRDAQGRLLIARQPRLDAYWGREAADEVMAGGAGGGQVVVQPDFTVVIIGQDQSAAGELIPFCDRQPGTAGQGALILRITREGVLRAARQGLSGEEMVGRLEKAASKTVPANVLHEVRAWSAGVRRISYEPVVLCRCSDAEASNELLRSVRGGQRLDRVTVALPAGSVTKPVRKALEKKGVFLDPR